MADLLRYRATSGERNFIELIKAPIFFERSFSNRDIARVPVQFRKKSQPSILKDEFSFFKYRPIQFHINTLYITYIQTYIYITYIYIYAYLSTYRTYIHYLYIYIYYKYIYIYTYIYIIIYLSKYCFQYLDTI